MVLDKIGIDGLAPTIDAVRNKLDQPLRLGYCSVGVVMEWTSGKMSPGSRRVTVWFSMASTPRRERADKPLRQGAGRCVG